MPNIATFLVTAILAQFSFPYSIISCKLVHDLFDTFSFFELFQVNQIVVGVFAIIMKEIHGFFNTHPEKRKIVVLAFSRVFKNISRGARNWYFFGVKCQKDIKYIRQIAKGKRSSCHINKIDFLTSNGACKTSYQFF